MVNRKDPADSTALPCSPGDVDEFIAQPNDAVVETVRRQKGPMLILGAGGKMGLHLSLMLRAAVQRAKVDVPVIAVSRFSTLRDQADFTQRGIEVIPCDLEDANALARLPDAPTVFFLAGVKFGTAQSPELLHRMNALMPRRVAQRFQRSTFVAFSTGCVYPFVSPSSGGATEDTPPAPVGAYALSCLERERAFNDAARDFGTRSVLIRLNYSVEFRYGVLVDVALKVLRNEPVDVTMGYANVIWQTDALRYAIQALDLAAAPAVPLNVTGPDLFSIRDIALRFGELLDRRVECVGTEAETAWLNNAARCHAKFGPPTVSLDRMQTWVAAWLSRGGELWGKPTGFERRDGNF